MQEGVIIIVINKDLLTEKDETDRSATYCLHIACLTNQELLTSLNDGLPPPHTSYSSTLLPFALTS